MEQRKSDINTDGNVVNVDTNGLSYSFDFSNQVETNNTMGPAVPIANPTVQPGQVNVQPTAVPVMQKAPTTAPVQPEATSVPLASEAPTPVSSDVPVEATAAPVEATNKPAEQAQPAVSFEQPAEAQAAQETAESEQTEEELIKDKKGTKIFLIFLFILVLSFIIGLPFIWRFLSNYF